MQKHSKIVKETRNLYECAGIKMKVLVVEDNEFSIKLSKNAEKIKDE